MNDLIITVASWEERFWLGFKRLTDESCPKNLLLYFYKEYASATKANRDRVEALSREKGIEVQARELSFQDPVRSWRTLFETITKWTTQKIQVTIDLATMPRETIWTILDLLDESEPIVRCVYHQPEAYSTEWLSRDPGKPRLVYKLAGEAKLGLHTTLLVLTGYDVDRVRQLITFFEPQCTLLGLQVGDQFDNQSLNVDRHKREFEGEQGIELFNVDAFSEDHGFNAIEKQLEPHLKNSNIVMSSLGPKLSAIALYHLHKKYPGTALAYAPSNEFNPEYSHGIGEMLNG